MPLHLHEDTTSYYGVPISILGLFVTLECLHCSHEGKKHLYSWQSFGVGLFVLLVVFGLFMEKNNRQPYRRWIAGVPAWIKVVRASVILICVSLVCYIGRDHILHRSCLFFSRTSSNTPNRFWAREFLYRRGNKHYCHEIQPKSLGSRSLLYRNSSLAKRD